MDVKKIGEAIRYLRLKEGYTQQDIADFLNISFQAVSKWERGLCVPDAQYLSKLAEYLNVDLDDLLEGNITYLDDEWRGLLRISNIQNFDRTDLLQMMDVMLSYFMLAGIRKIKVQTDYVLLSDMLDKYQDGSLWGIQIEYMDFDQPLKLYSNTMIVSELVFLYGTNLTKYFWRAMARTDGVSILTIGNAGTGNECHVTYDKKHLITSAVSGDNSALPILFAPRMFIKDLERGYEFLVRESILYAEPTTRGLIKSVMRSEETMREVLQLWALIESVTGGHLYDLMEIAKERFLRR